MHIYQPPGDVFELPEAILSGGCRASRVEPYELEPIRIPMSFDKLVDVPIYHPLRCHREVASVHCHTQQR